MARKSVDYTLIQDLLDKTKEEIEKMQPVTILLVGKTGVGKSTLVNNVFREKLAKTGIGKPITKHLRRIQKDGIPIILYDTRGLELSEKIQEDVKKEIFDQLEKNKKQDLSEAVDIVYYCINANSSRIEEYEIDFINELAEQVPVIIVLTQSIGQPAQAFKKYIDQLNLQVVSTVPIMAEPYMISDGLTIPQTGLKELIEVTFSTIPEESRAAFNNAQQVDIARKAKAARSWAVRYTATTFGVGFIPIPFSDASVLVPMQIGMLAHITAIFGISMDKSSVAGIIGAVGGTSGATYIGRYVVSNLIKLIPGAGTIAGGLIGGGTASILTSALALSYIEVLSFIAKGEKDGKYPDLANIQKLMRESLQKRLKRGKKDPEIEDFLQEAENAEKKPQKKNRFFKNPFKKKLGQ